MKRLAIILMAAIIFSLFVLFAITWSLAVRVPLAIICAVQEAANRAFCADMEVVGRGYREIRELVQCR